MADPARKHPIHGETKPAGRAPGEDLSREIDVVQRWVEGPDGRMQLLELPLTPELFLDPQDEDKIIQHPVHHRTVNLLFDWIDHHLASQPDVVVGGEIPVTEPLHLPDIVTASGDVVIPPAP